MKVEKNDIIIGLEKLVGSGSVFSDEASVIEAGKDYINFRCYQRAAGYEMAPRASCVVKPKSVEEVSKVLAFLNENKVATTPRTGGSSVTQSIEPEVGGVIVDGHEMNDILELNERNMTVTVRCGTPLEYLENYLNRKGYSTGHFPQSIPLADMGGLVATRSIGQFSTLYGGIEDLVVGLEAVLPDGEVVRIKNNPRRSCGPDLRHLFIGSEGMTGFITEVTVKIFPYRPEDRWMCAYHVEDMHAGLEFIREVAISGYTPAVVRLHDYAEVDAVLKMADVVPEGRAIILFLADGPKEIADATGAGIERISKKYEAESLGEKPIKSWLKTRNDPAYTMDDGIHYKMGAVVDTCEISANWDVVGEIYDAVIERLTDEIDTLIHASGHSSHNYRQGTNIYFIFGFMENDGVRHVEKHYMDVVKIIMEETLKRGGSIAHHHGSGKYRTKWMPDEHGNSYSLLYKIKEALDPANIMNKGVLLVDK